VSTSNAESTSAQVGIPSVCASRASHSTALQKSKFNSNSEEL